MWYVFEVVTVTENLKTPQVVKTRFPQGFPTENDAQNYITQKMALPAFADSTFEIREMDASDFTLTARDLD